MCLLKIGRYVPHEKVASVIHKIPSILYPSPLLTITSTTKVSTIWNSYSEAILSFILGTNIATPTISEGAILSTRKIFSHSHFESKVEEGKCKVCKVCYQYIAQTSNH